MKRCAAVALLATASLLLVTIAVQGAKHEKQKPEKQKHGGQPSPSQFLGSAEDNAQQLIDQGRQTFRFDTFGDEAFWSGQLQDASGRNLL